MSAPVQIRSATPDDAFAMHAVHVAAITALDVYPQDVKRKWLALLSPNAFTDRPADEFRAVAEVDGRIVAFGEVDLRRALVLSLYVHPSLAREGVGTLLLAELEQRARAAGLRTLEVLSGLNAEGFYVRSGYRVVGMAAKRVTADFTVEGIQMEKRL